MFPSNGSDIELSFNPESFLRNLSIANKARADFEKGVEGAGPRMAASYEKLASAMISQSSRVEQAQNRMVKSLEMRAATAGQSGIERLISERNKLLSQYPKIEDADKKQVDRINRITEAYKKLIEVQQKSDAASAGGAGAGTIAFRAARDLFEGRTAYGVVQAGQGISGLGGGTAVAAGLAAGLVVLTAASVSAMKSLADLGVEVNDVKLRTGLTTKQVGEFSFAAKAVGQDVSVFERAMRGLTQAVEDQSSSGDKARQWLVKFGVDVRGLRDGTAGTADTFERISSGISSMTSPLERNKAMLDLFKRAGVEIIPVMEQLDKNLKIAKDYGFGLNDEQLQRFLRYKEQMTIIAAKWDMVVRSVKEFIAAPVASILLDPQLAFGGGGVARARASAAANAGPPAFDYEAAQRLINQSKINLRLQAGQEGDAAVRRYQGSLGLNWQIQEAERALGKLGAPEVGVSSPEDVKKYAAAQALVDSLKQRQKITEQIKTYEEDIAKVQIEAAERAAHPFGMTPTEKQVLDFQKNPAYATPEGRAALTAAMPGFQSEIDREKKQVVDEIVGKNFSKLLDALAEMTNKLDERARGVYAIQATQTQKEMEQTKQQFGAAQEILRYQSATGLQAAEVSARVGGILGPQTPAGRYAAEQALTRLKIAGINTESQQQQGLVASEYQRLYGQQTQLGLQQVAAAKPEDRAAVEKNAAEQLQNIKEQGENRLQELRLKNAEEVGKLQDDILVKQAEEIRRQIDEIKKPAEKLFETLFTHPQKFGKELEQTVRQAATKPAVDMLSEQTARFLQPVIFGSHTNSGLNSVAVTDGAMHVKVVGATGGGAGGSGGSSGGGGFSGGGSTAGYGTGGGVQFNGAGFANAGQSIVNGLGGGTINPAAMFRGIYGGISSGINFLGNGIASGASAIGSGVGWLGSTIAHGASWLGGGIKSLFTGSPAPAGTVSGSVNYAGGGSDTFGGSVQGGGGGGFSGGGGTAGGYGSGVAAAVGPTTSLGIPGAPGGTSGFAGPVGLFGGAPSLSGGGGGVGGGGLAGIFNAKSISGIAGSFKGLSGGLGGFSRGAVGSGTTGYDDEGNPTSISSGPGRITGLTGLAKGGVSSAGMLAANWGLLGSGQGTAGGVAAGALGGAAVGFAAGGPLGAAIGGAVGLGIGVGEVIAGVEPQWREAERLVKSIYGININRQEANQIVQIAQSKYGNTVSVAVRSPEVRQMLGIYAAGTGQGKNFPQSADQPHGVSLIEQGGQLQQAATYQYGSAYLQQSSIKTAPGNSGAQQLPAYQNYAPSSVNLSLNVGGAGIAPFMLGNVITPDVVSSQYADAMQSSNGRTDSALTFDSPGEIVS